MHESGVSEIGPLLQSVRQPSSQQRMMVITSVSYLHFIVSRLVPFQPELPSRRIIISFLQRLSGKGQRWRLQSATFYLLLWMRQTLVNRLIRAFFCPFRGNDCTMIHRFLKAILIQALSSLLMRSNSQHNLENLSRRFKPLSTDSREHYSGHLVSAARIMLRY